jgi:hypothetical protein
MDAMPATRAFSAPCMLTCFPGALPQATHELAPLALLVGPEHQLRGTPKNNAGAGFPGTPRIRFSANGAASLAAWGSAPQELMHEQDKQR